MYSVAAGPAGPSPSPWVWNDDFQLPPSLARVNDWALGGGYNLDVDRRLFEQVHSVYPEARAAAHASRAMIYRGIRWLLEHTGVRQFLDLGSGIPTVGAVHEIVHDTHPAARVAAIDIDPAAVWATQRLITSPYAMVVRGDIRHLPDYLYGGQIPEFLDYSEPVAIIAGAVLHCIPDRDQPATLLADIAAGLVDGSYLVLTHVGPETTSDGQRRLEMACRLIAQTPTPVTIRSAEQIAALLDGAFEICAPGIVTADQWLPDPYDALLGCPPSVLAAIARRTPGPADRTLVMPPASHTLRRFPAPQPGSPR